MGRYKLMMVVLGVAVVAAMVVGGCERREEGRPAAPATGGTAPGGTVGGVGGTVGPVGGTIGGVGGTVGGVGGTVAPTTQGAMQDTAGTYGRRAGEEAKDVFSAIVDSTMDDTEQAIRSGGLDKTLQGAGPFTIFSPVDGAWDDLGDGVHRNLLAPENKDALVKILQHHVVQGHIMKDQLKSGQSLQALDGTQLTVTVADGKIMVGGAEVEDVDDATMASNGMVYKIKSVLVPQGVQLPRGTSD